jgi:2-amino-4-hydroxy-6-hydroxymethyldihydropteridine diphosphokinase
MTRAVLSIGSNLGDRLAHLRSVVDAFAPQLVAVSSVYSTAPWGGVPQQHYLNAVLVVDDPVAEPLDWLRRGQALEQAADRVREVRWGARTLDVDVVWCAQPCPPGGSDGPGGGSLRDHEGTRGRRIPHSGSDGPGGGSLRDHEGTRGRRIPHSGSDGPGPGSQPVRSTDPTLTLPHPHAHERAFVLVPWLEVEPDAVLEVAGRPRPIRELLAGLDAAERNGVRRTAFTLLPDSHGGAS